MPRPSLFNVDEFFIRTQTSLCCRMCSRDFKSFKNSNLKYHLENTHHLIFNPQTIKPNQSKCDFVRCTVRKNVLIKSYFGLLTDDGVTMKALSSDHMKKILDPICTEINRETEDTLPFSPESFRKTLARLAQHIVMDISSECRNRLISLKVDTATISAQFVKDDKLVYRVLSMIGTSGVPAKSSIDLSKEIMNTLQKYDINLQQILTITTDDVRNILKPFAFRQSSLDAEEVKREEIEENYDNEMYFHNIEEIDKCPEWKVGVIPITACPANMAQMVILDTNRDRAIKKYIWNCRNLVKFLKRDSNGYVDLFKSKLLKMPELDCPTQWGSTYSMISNIRNSKTVIETVKSENCKSLEENFEINNDLWNFIHSYCEAVSPLQNALQSFQKQQMSYGDFYVTWLQCKLRLQKIVEESSRNKNSDLYKTSVVVLGNIKKRNKALFANPALSACLYLDPRFHHLLPEQQKREAIDFFKDLWVKLMAVKNAIVYSQPRELIDERQENEKEFQEESIGIVEHVKLKTENLVEPNEISVLITGGEVILKPEKMDVDAIQNEDVKSVRVAEQLDEDAEDLILRTFLEKEYFANQPRGQNNNDSIVTKLEQVKIASIKHLYDVFTFWKQRKINDPEIYALSNVCFGIPATQVSNQTVLSSLKSVTADVSTNCGEDNNLENLLLIKLNPDLLKKSILELDLSFSVLESLGNGKLDSANIQNFIRKAFLRN